jgi:membrane fusion protein (multidrug efflux system)
MTPSQGPADPTAAASAARSARSGTAPNSARRRALLGVSLLVVVGALGYALSWWLLARGSERTDNAYVHAPMVQVAAQQAGTVITVGVEDTDHVTAGQMLLRLDPAESRLARERAEAQLAQAVREVRASFARDPVDEAGIRRQEAELQRVRTEESRAADDLARRGPLAASGAMGAEELAHAQSALAAARAARAAAQSALDAAREQRAMHRTQIDGLRIDQHPIVQRAATALREALLSEARNEIPAPVAGQIARRSVQVGQRVSAGQTLMS